MPWSVRRMDVPEMDVAAATSIPVAPPVMAPPRILAPRARRADAGARQAVRPEVLQDQPRRSGGRDHPVLPAGDREIAGGEAVRAPLDPQGRPGVAHGHTAKRDVFAIGGDPGDGGALDRRGLHGEALGGLLVTTPRRPPVIISWSSATFVLLTWVNTPAGSSTAVSAETVTSRDWLSSRPPLPSAVVLTAVMRVPVCFSRPIP